MRKISFSSQVSQTHFLPSRSSSSHRMLADHEEESLKLRV
jgi:hypothetical protein